MAEVVDINAAVKEMKQPEKNPESKATAKMVNDLMKQAQTATKDMRKEWPDNYRFVVGGEQWPIRRPRWRFSEVINVTWANIMTEVGIQTDSKPKTEYTGVEASDLAFTEILNKLNDVNWSKSSVTGHGWQRKLTTAVFKSKLYHVIHALVGWDQEMEDGIGDINFKILDPYGCFWDPNAKDISEARWFIYAEPVPTGKLKKDYPNVAELLRPDLSMFDNGNTDGIDDHDIDRLWRQGSLGTGASTDRGDREGDQYGGEPMTLHIKCWMKDDTVEELQNQKTSGDGIEEVEFVKKLKFPRGRYIEVASNVVLEDRENEYEDGRFPIATLVNYDYGEYCGENEVTFQRGPQTIINYTWSHILDQMKMASNPQTVVSHQAADIVKKITNEPGLVLEVADVNSVRREPGVGIAPGMFNILDKSFELIDKVGGLQDATKGAQSGATSALMLEGLVEAAQVRPRLKNRSVDEFLSQVGYLMASRYLQFYSVPRTFRVTNEQGFPEFVEFFIKEDEQGQKIANVTVQSEQPDGTLSQPTAQQVPVKGLPDIKVTSGSSLPFARALKSQTAKELFNSQAIDREELLSSIDWPNHEDVARRMQEKEQAAAEQAAAEQGV